MLVFWDWKQKMILLKRAPVAESKRSQAQNSEEWQQSLFCVMHGSNFDDRWLISMNSKTHLTSAIMFSFFGRSRHHYLLFSRPILKLFADFRKSIQSSKSIVRTWIVGNDFHRLIEPINSNLLITIDYIDYNDCLSLIVFMDWARRL